MDRNDKVAALAHGGQPRILCIDNHASSNFSCFLLARSGYQVNRVGFFSDALDLIRSSSYDLYLINDELVRSGKELFERVREAAGSAPMVFYSMVVYPFSPRLADQSGNTPETPVPVTEVAIAVARAIKHESTRPIASICAA
jgi:hypothetical protein